MSVPEDPRWPRACHWLQGEHFIPALGRVSVLGAPIGLGSITPGRCDQAPGAIRHALRRFSTYDIESDRDVRHLDVKDHGDLLLKDMLPEAAFKPICEGVRKATASGEVLVLLGGDNSITRPAVHGVAGTLERCGLLMLDAHLDYRTLDWGLTNGNPVRALLSDGLPGSQVIQIGIQPFVNSGAYAGEARQAGITIHTVDEVRRRGIETIVAEALETLASRVDTIYFDLDLDVMDRSSSPGTPGSRPGGLSFPEVRRATEMCGEHPKVGAIDLVELDPCHDVADITAFTAGSCLLAFAAGLVKRLQNGRR